MVDWESGKLRAMVELVAAVAVLVGLIFVGLELRQNTDAVQAATLQSQTDASTEFLQLIAADADLARIVFQARGGGGQLSELDSFRNFMLVRARWIRIHNAYLQWQRGTLSEDDWKTIESRICGSDLDGPAPYSSTWEDHRSTLSDGFVSFVEDCWSASQWPKKR
jgi:hypothetical protein